MTDSEPTLENAQIESDSTTNKDELEISPSVDLKSETVSIIDSELKLKPVELDKEHQPKVNTIFTEEAIAPNIPRTSHIEQRLSNDQTDQIQMTYLQEENVSYNSPENIFGQKRIELGPVVDISSNSSCEEEEELSDLISYLADFGIKGDREPIDRAACEAEFAEAKEYNLSLRRKNGLLNKKISEYYYKRKIARVFDSGNVDMYESMAEKYQQKIYDLYELVMKTSREKEAVDNEITDMIHLRDDQKEHLAKSFTEMQRREAEVMRGLIDSNTGKVISDKIIEKLLARQKVKSETISEIRLAYIKRRDRIKSIEQKIKSLETIGGTLHLMDFEQLRMENQTYSDKIEERDDELMRLRDRYAHAIQANAHIREKINIVEVQIDDLRERCFLEDINVTEARADLNKLKMKRDMYRATREKLKINTGILTYPKLLMDMENGMKSIENIRIEIDSLIAINKENHIKLNNIRHTIERTEYLQARKSYKKLKIPRGFNKKISNTRSSLVSRKSSLKPRLKPI